jgi:2-dehydro-3-deoxyphosphogluconate aldolase/(4S)-4-hydroxy-2-oxoglutarate aldolase
VSDAVDRIVAARVVPVVVLDDAAAADPLAEALAAGGLAIAEITFRTPAAHNVLRRFARHESMLVGAGTVVRADQVDQAVDAGARFIVSPGVSGAVINRCAELAVPVFPGVATATELMAALDCGVQVVKFFPATVLGGLAGIAALAGPFPGVRFVPTGGIGAGDLATYLAHPAVLAVGGSWMVANSLIAADRFDEVTRLTAAAVEVARQSQVPSDRRGG